MKYLLTKMKKTYKRLRKAEIERLLPLMQKKFNAPDMTLDELHRRGCKVYLLSNAQASFTRPEMESLGLVEKFDGIFYEVKSTCAQVPTPPLSRRKIPVCLMKACA